MYVVKTTADGEYLIDPKGWSWTPDRRKAHRFVDRDEAVMRMRDVDRIHKPRVVKLVPRRKAACQCDAAKAVAKVEGGGTVLMNALDAKTLAADLTRLLRIEACARECLDNYDEVADSEGPDIKRLRTALESP